MAARSRQPYPHQVRYYIAWLRASSPVDGDPLADAGTPDWAVRDYKRHLNAVERSRPASGHPEAVSARLRCETRPVEGLGGVGVRVVENVERALAVADLKLECLARLDVVDRYRDVAVEGVPEQLDVDAVAYPALQFARRRRDVGDVGSGEVVTIMLGCFGCVVCTRFTSCRAGRRSVIGGLRGWPGRGRLSVRRSGRRRALRGGVLAESRCSSGGCGRSRR